MPPVSGTNPNGDGSVETNTDVTNLDLRTKAVEERLSCPIEVFAHSEGMSGEGPKYLRSQDENTAKVKLKHTNICHYMK